VSKLIDEFDSNFENEGGIRHAIIDIVESRRADAPSFRMVGEETLFQVAERALESSTDLEPDVRYFAALREVNNFITFATEGAISETVTKHADLLPPSHPNSTESAVMTASAQRMLRAQWVAADPRISDESVRAIVASVYSSNPLSVDYAYHLARLESLEEGQVPADLLIQPLLAFGDPYAGKNSFWHRSMRAKKQRRDDEGQFAEMGGGYRFYVRNNLGQIMSVVGKVAGFPENDPLGIDIEVSGVKGIRDGIYTIPSSYGHSFKAILPEHAVAKAVRVADRNVDFVEMKDLVRKELPTSWFPTKGSNDNTDLENKAKADRFFATGDGYVANLFNFPAEDLAKRIAEAQQKFGSLIVSDQGTDTLNPDKPVYELISTKRGQPEVVGYSQDWATLQKFASDEDDKYPDAENEPVAQEMATPKKPSEPEEPVADATDLTAEPTNAGEESEPDNTFDPVKELPESWESQGDGVFTSKDGGLVAIFGNSAVDLVDSSYFDESTGEQDSNPSRASLGDTFTVYDAMSGTNMGIAFDWDGVQRVGDMVSMHPSTEPTIQEMASADLNLDELLPNRYDLIQPTEQVAKSADANNPISQQLKYAIYAAIQNHEATDEMIDMWDEMARNWGGFSTAQAKTLMIAINSTPKTAQPITRPQAIKRSIIRKQLAHREIPDAQRAAVETGYRQYDEELIQLMIDTLNTLPMKGAKAVPADKKEDAAEEVTSVAKSPLNPAKVNVMKAAFANHDVDRDMVQLFDDIMTTPDKFSNEEVQAFINQLNSLPQKTKVLASYKQRQLIKNFAGRESVPSDMRDSIMGEYLDYTYDQADAKIKELTQYIDLQEIEGRKKTADEIAREHGLPSATPNYLTTNLVDGQNPPKPRQLVMLESLIENRDFSSESAKGTLDTLMRYHQGMTWVQIQDYIKDLQGLPFKQGFQPSMLSSNISVEDGGPTPRMLRSLERKYVKGLISDDLWAEIVRDLPDMKGTAVSAKYIAALDDLETKYDDAILTRSMEGGYEIEGLRIPSKSTVTIPEDYVPSLPGEWIAQREEEINAAVNKMGGTPDIIDSDTSAALADAVDGATSADYERTIDKRELETAAAREALREDLKNARNMISRAASEISDALANTPKKILKADARRILQNALTDLYALKAVMDMRRRFILSKREFDNRLTSIARAVLPGDDSASPYGTLKTRTPEVLEILGISQALIAQAIGTYNAGIGNESAFETVPQEMATEANKPSMRFFSPPTFAGEALEPLRGMDNYNDISEFLSNQDIYVVDLETTGLPDLDDPDIKNDPIQIAVTKMSGLRVVDKFTTYINPESKISSYTLMGVGDGRGGKVTGEFLESFPSKRDAMSQLLDFIPRGAIIAGHNSTLFDMEVINRTIEEAGLEPLNPGGYIDTLGMARYLMPEWTPENPDAPFKINKYGQQTKSFSLESLVTYFGLSNNGRHEADADVASTVEVFQKMLDRAQRGLGVMGRDFNFEESENGWNPEAYKAAQDAYRASAAQYLLGRVSDLLAIEGMSPEQADRTINNIIEAISNGAEAGQADNRTPVSIPAKNPLRELHAGSYVADVENNRVGISMGIVGDHVLVDMPAVDILATGRFILEKILPEKLAKVTEKFLSKNGVFLEYGMEVSSSKIPGNFGSVRSLADEPGNVYVGVGDFLSPIPVKDLSAVENQSPDSAASPKQEAMIINLVDGLVAAGVIDRATANGYQKAADGHFYSRDVANKIIMRLTTAAQQNRQLQANNDIDVPAGPNPANESDVQEMATPKKKTTPADTKTSADIKLNAKTKKAIEELDMKPTKEGENIIGAVASGWNVVIKALAGVGKTTNLRLAAEVLQKVFPIKKILYVVFNKENQIEAEEKMPLNTEARTGDSISYGADVNEKLKRKFELLPDQVQSMNYPINPRNYDALVDGFGIKDVMLSGDRKLQRRTLARAAYDILSEWVRSDAKSIGKKQVDAVELGVFAPETDADYSVYIKLAQAMWADILSDHDELRNQILVTHDHMFKNWALTDPNLAEVGIDGKSPHGLKEIPQVLFLDEAQDINPVFLDLIEKQYTLHKNGIQIVAVGDTNQRIFGFRGTTDALARIIRDITLPLTKSFRTGDGILRYANRILRALGEPLRLTGRDGDGSSVVPRGEMDDPDLVIVRKNASILEVGIWSDIIHPGKRIATTANFKQRLTETLDTLEWLIYGAKPDRRPKNIARDLIGFPTWDSLKTAASREDGDPQIKMIMGLLYATQKRLKTIKISEAVDELKRIVREFRVHNDNFSIPATVGKRGDLGGNISYEIVKDKLVLTDTKFIPYKKVGFGVRDNQVAMEDAGFTRSEEKNEKGFQKWEWQAQVKGDIRKQLAGLIKALRGEDAIMRAMTGHTVKGLEAGKVKVWHDWSDLSNAFREDATDAEKKMAKNQSENMTADEMNLFYVVLTRARDLLDPGALEWIITGKGFPESVAGVDSDGTTEVQEMATKRDLPAAYVDVYEKKLARIEADIKTFKDQLKLSPEDRVDGLSNPNLESLLETSEKDLADLKSNPQMVLIDDMNLYNRQLEVIDIIQKAIDAGEEVKDIEALTDAQRAFTRVKGATAKLPSLPIAKNRMLIEALRADVERLYEKLDYANQLDYSPDAVESQEMATPESGSVVPDERLRQIARSAAEFYNNRLMKFSDATEAADYIKSRGFSKNDAESFDLGYAPKNWADLYQHLKKQGFSEEEMLESGVIKQSERNGKYYDALRDRIVFPVRDANGRTAGFIGRALDPDEPIRYMRTAGNAINQKSEILHGLDKATDEISRTGQMIVVEGQFDLLAMHAAGITNTVATSGTAFNEKYVDLFNSATWNSPKKEIIFAFDSDEAGLKAAERAYEFVKGSDIVTYVVSDESGLDPADIYSKDNEDGLKTLLDNKKPMLEYLIERILAAGNISTPEGRQAAIQAIADLLRGVSDEDAVLDLVKKYAIRLGMSEKELLDQVR